ncbi:hypothetical protein HPP92_009501 [Vanilla planifolia]|uniref:Morc S5 domain-containing protein n=1 Tax=Vanilla planifolia TaxID=51239 RepID=A0A835V8X3_VANPL|nr:hypothetical protein HPP92_009501 [Vanilla planifolia]
MSAPEVIDLCSDDETELWNIKDVKPILVSTNSTGVANGYSVVDRLCLPEQGIKHLTTFQGCFEPHFRQFWKSGDYDPGQSPKPLHRSGTNRLRIHPKFLHSNATSHKWAFGAIAELLDNAIDEVQSGATFVIIDKFVNPRNGDIALLIQDDGGGMDPDSLRQCMSFGFSNKQSGSTIGQYGNGFKTSTMRLGADVIVFSCCMKRRKVTHSIGLLSYTFLRKTGCDDIVVPVVDYVLNPATGAFNPLLRINEKQFSTNLFTLLKWSPFATEEELLKQFDDIGHHGTKIIVFNLWHNDDGIMELDFVTDAKDILISGAQKKLKKVDNEAELIHQSIASRYQFSLRVYASILYLKQPESFKIVLRKVVVEPHHLVKDLMYIECIRYRPQVDVAQEAVVDTTIGFMKGAPNINVHGFNVYHKNRLILPYWRVAHNSYGKGRGVVGVLEANFIKPTHDKQDFERSSIYQKLELRLKEMTYEYWDLYSHLVGYKNKKIALDRASFPQLPPTDSCSSLQQHKMNGEPSPCGCFEFYILSSRDSSKRKRECRISEPEALSCVVPCEGGDSPSGNHKAMAKLKNVANGKQKLKSKALLQENKRLREQCVENEEIEKQLMLKEKKLRSELREVEQKYSKLLAELKMMDEIKMEKC